MQLRLKAHAVRHILKCDPYAQNGIAIVGQRRYVDIEVLRLPARQMTLHRAELYRATLLKHLVNG